MPRLLAALRRNWLSACVLLVGAAYAAGEESLRVATGGDVFAVADAAVELALVVALAAGVAVFGRQRDVAARLAADSERRLRAMLDGMGLLAVAVSGDGSIRYVNRATYELLGREPDSLNGTSVFDLLELPDPAAARLGLRTAAESRTIPETADVPVPLPGGGRRSVRWHLALAESGTNADVIAIGEDITDAIETRDRLRALLATAPIGICAVDADGIVRIAEGGPFVRVLPGAPGQTAAAPRLVDDLPAPFVAPLRAALAGRSSEALLQLDGRTYEATFSVADRPGDRHGALGVFVEVTQAANLEREGSRLATAIDQAMDAVVITNPDGVITYVNPAFVAVTGYAREEAIGQKPSVLKSGEQTDAFYSGLWRTITAGRPWKGELVNRRKDGTLFREVATITPVRDRDGSIVNFVAVKRDVTRERALEAALDREVRERAAIVTALERIGSSGDPAAIGAAVCEEVIQLPGMGMAAVFVFDDHRALTLAFVGPSDVPVAQGRPLPASRAEYLRSRAALGPWAEPWQVREADGPYGERMAEAGVQAVAYIPLRDEAGVFGVLGLGTFSRVEARTLLDRLPALGALGAVASSQLSVSVRRTMAQEGAHRDVKTLIDARAFHPVFQPIVDLRTGEALGYEALTRFDNGTRPDIEFQRAVGVGLGVELDMVTMEAAVAAATGLPTGAFLTLNVSPDTALRPGVLAGVLANADRPVVLEITEHAAIDDYAALRAVARSLPVPARLAVDDAGAGFASLRHVLELAPDIVKIDRTIVEGIDHDPARQALVAGLRHFASRRGIQLIAEGIETQGELAALTSLAIPLGQGYLLGRPVPLSDITGTPISLPLPLPSGSSNGRSAGSNGRSGGPNGRASGSTGRPGVAEPRKRAPAPPDEPGPADPTQSTGPAAKAPPRA